MRALDFKSLVGHSSLVLAAAACLVLPDQLIEQANARPAAGANVVRLNGVVRDFRSSHADFGAGPSAASGHIVNLTSDELSSTGKPVYDGAGSTVVVQAKDSSGNNIAPVMAHTAPVNFNITGGNVVLQEAAAAKVTVLGAAMQNPYLQMRVTVRLKVGSTTSDPFGSFTNSSTGNVHDSNNPRNHVVPGTVAGGTPMAVLGRSFYKLGSSWLTLQTVDSSTGSTWVKVLRNGDSTPDIPAYGSQSSIQSFLQGYVDTTTKKVTIADNQAIFLFELATTDPNSPYVDFQDLVVLITMAKDAASLSTPPTPPATTCGPDDDSTATLDPTPHNGAIASENSFRQWFSDTLGVNASGAAPIDLVRQANGNYVFDDTTDPHYSKLGGFFPADGRLFGDKDASGHNTLFTYYFEAMFTYDESVPQFFSVYTDMEVWVFINDKLVIDMGGFHGMLEQRIDLSRLCLTDGGEYKLAYFMASRHAPNSRLRIETNLDFGGASTPPPTHAVSAGHD